jgi:hypothetical protein
MRELLLQELAASERERVQQLAKQKGQDGSRDEGRGEPMEGSGEKEQPRLPPAHDTRAWDILNNDAKVLQKRWVRVITSKQTLIN